MPTQQKSINLKPAIFAAVIILIVSLLNWWDYNGSHFSRGMRRAVNFLFPHEVLLPLRFMILPPIRPDAWHHIPLFSILLALFSFYALYRYSKNGNRLPLQIACGILIISIIIDIPPMVRYYIRSVQEYRNYTPTPGNGIYSMLDEFTAPQKPSLGLFIAGLVVLGLYVYGAARLLIRLMYNHTKL